MCLPELAAPNPRILKNILAKIECLSQAFAMHKHLLRRASSLVLTMPKVELDR